MVMPVHPLDELPWIPEAIANLMARHGIRSRTELARRLHLYTSVVTQAFDENWAGRATVKLLARMNSVFGVDIGLLVVQPASVKQHRPVNGQHVVSDKRTTGKPNPLCGYKSGNVSLQPPKRAG